MTIAPETIVRHELVGLDVEVYDDPDDRGGIRGDIVDETTNTLRVRTEGETKTVPKAGARFAFDLPDGTTVVVDGDQLVARPARRTEPTGGTIWHSA